MLWMNRLANIEDNIKQIGEQIKNPLEITGFCYGASAGARTPNLLIRSQTLYPIELRTQ